MSDNKVRTYYTRVASLTCALCRKAPRLTDRFNTGPESFICKMPCIDGRLLRALGRGGAPRRLVAWMEAERDRATGDTDNDTSSSGMTHCSNHAMPRLSLTPACAVVPMLRINY